jgi:hypothetical protein
MDYPALTKRPCPSKKIDAASLSSKPVSLLGKFPDLGPARNDARN